MVFKKGSWYPSALYATKNFQPTMFYEISQMKV